jgi:hypothetical protein
MGYSPDLYDFRAVWRVEGHPATVTVRTQLALVYTKK